MTPDQLRTAGEAIWGAEFVAPLARALEINERTVRRWLSREKAIPPDAALADRMRQLLLGEADRLRQVAASLQQADMTAR